MKNRIFAGFLLALMMIFSVVPAFAEPVETTPATEAAPATEAPDEAIPAEEAPATEAPAEEAPAEAVPAEPEPAPAPELPKYDASNNFTLKEAKYDPTAKTITMTIANNTDIPQGIPYIILDFDTAQVEITPDMAQILDASIAAQIGVEVKSGVIILVQKIIEEHEEQTIILDANIKNYNANALPTMGLRIFVQAMPNTLDLTAAGKENANKLTVQTFENMFTAVQADEWSFMDFVKENWMLVSAIAILIILIIVLIIRYILVSSKAKDESAEYSLDAEEANSEDTIDEEIATESDSDEQNSLIDEDGGNEDEEV